MAFSQKTDQARRRRYWGAACLLLIVGVALCSSVSPVRSEATTTPTPLFDRLATPVVPDHPTAADLGRQVYYLHCMPCHGDVGQGLTDEWRAVWVDDHQNCWAKGCHGGRVDDEGFPLPKTIPAVIGPAASMAQRATSAELVAYLTRTHPPQRPGKLAQQEYEQVTAFLWHENERDTMAAAPPEPLWLVAGGFGVVAATLGLVYRARRMRTRHER
jgi:hypothetical protein